MQASRVSSRAFRAIVAGSKQTRGLHMTGPATFSSLLTSERPAMNLPRDLAGLRSDSAIETSKRPVPSNEPGKLVRHFNTSRSLKAVGDSSTIDFAFIPDFDPDTHRAPVGIRVPILPQTTTTYSAIAEEAEEPMMLPTIHTVADNTQIHAPAAQYEGVEPNYSDFQGMASYAAKKLGREVEEGAGMARQIWAGLMDDILRPQGPTRA
ncbi:hypothetical protein P280DRAFT_395258 [Massarina eburnea CBS 473.64]|uniref:Uncharacterized protein n=1 Tax=Massarina eburnea CBS 473.64 TaxID=1395130 RepID=A0A6A6S7U0_9PLEO|nr:hypothetical protein P280DRAFT_395258 [Massarina eburnea CBS 473.64]